MLLYNAVHAPNPRRVRIFLAEKGVTVPTTDISILTGELRSAAFLKVNPLGQVPDDMVNLKAWHARVSARPSAQA